MSKNCALELSHKWTHKRSSELQALQNAPPSQLLAVDCRTIHQAKSGVSARLPVGKSQKKRLKSETLLYILNIFKKKQPCNSSPLSDGPAAQLAANGSVCLRKSIFQPTSSTPQVTMAWSRDSRVRKLLWQSVGKNAGCTGDLTNSFGYNQFTKAAREISMTAKIWIDVVGLIRLPKVH